MPPRKYFPPLPEEVESALGKLKQQDPNRYWGRDAIAATIGKCTAGKYVEPVADNLVTQGVIDGIECQASLLPRSIIFRFYRSKINQTSNPP